MVGTASELEGSLPDVAEPGPTARGPGARRAAVRGPALVVLGLAVLIVVVGLIGAAVASGPATTTTTPVLRQVTLSDGTTIALQPGSRALSSLSSQGQPPSDVLDAVVLPSGSTRTGTVDDDRAAGGFDRWVSFEASRPGDEIVGAYKQSLPRLGWNVIYSGAGARHGHPGTEVLAKRGASDGYEWEIGVVVSPATATGVTPFSVELFQLSGVT